MPGDQFVPGDQIVLGDPFIINGIVVEDYLLRAVQKVREAHRMEGADALFLIALPAEREAAEGMETRPMIVLFTPRR